MRKLAMCCIMGIVLCLFMTPVAFAQTYDNSPAIIRIKHSIMTVQELEQQGLITQAEATKSIAYYLAQASQEEGHPVTLHEMLATPDPTSQQLTPLQEFVGAIDFLRIILVLGIIAVAGALSYLFKFYVKKLLQLFLSVPIAAYEVIFYAACVGCGIGGWFSPEPIHSSLGFFASLLFVAALGFSTSHRRSLAHVFLFSGLLFLVWAPMAVLFNSSLVGFMAMGALLSALGFSEPAKIMFASLRFRQHMVIEKATFAAFLVLALFIGLKAIIPSVPALTVFEFGALFLGSLVGYVGLFVLSMRWYNRNQRERYGVAQVAAIVAGLGALFFGSIFQISALQKIGGTFFVVYCLAKIGDIPAKNRPAFALLIALVGSLSICFCWFALTHQDLFRQWLFLPS